MSETRDNHFVPQWYLKGFFEDNTELFQLKRKTLNLPTGEIKTIESIRKVTPAQSFYVTDLYTTFFGADVNDDIERHLFGIIDDSGSKAIRSFLTDDASKWHYAFQDFFIYLDAQKLRTPKGLDWIKSKYLALTQSQLMQEMQYLRSIHCTLWTESVREFVSAEDSEVKFIVSDHPITIYNRECPPESDHCAYPNDPDIALKGSQTIFPLDKNRCLILTNLDYAKAPGKINPLEQRINAVRIRQSMVNTIAFINERKLTDKEVTKINYIIKMRSNEVIAAGRQEWLHPEKKISCRWEELHDVLLPPNLELYRFGGEMFAQFENGEVHYQDAYGRTSAQPKWLTKNTDEKKIGRNDYCGCGSGKKYKKCCQNIRSEFRTTWTELSIRERNIAFCTCIKDVLGLNSGKTWLDVRRDISDEQIQEIYRFYSALWPRETEIYSLLPKSDGKFRALYTGVLDVRQINNILPLASIFDEFLIEAPITNPNNLKPNFSPVTAPGAFKYQALKDILFMFELEPYIVQGVVNLIPDPSEFDLNLKKAMMNIADSRFKSLKISKSDELIHTKNAVEDFLNSMSMTRTDTEIKFLSEEFGIPKDVSTQIVELYEQAREVSPLALLQQIEPGTGGQFMQFHMGPNYEMALLIAQVTGSILITDSETRWSELCTSIHRNNGVSEMPWQKIYDELKILPIDYRYSENPQNLYPQYVQTKNTLKSIDKIVREKSREEKQLNELTNACKRLAHEIENTNTKGIQNYRLTALSPSGGLYDKAVQRLLAQSSCLKYDHQVRSIFGINIKNK